MKRRESACSSDCGMTQGSPFAVTLSTCLTERLLILLIGGATTKSQRTYERQRKGALSGMQMARLFTEISSYSSSPLMLSLRPRQGTFDTAKRLVLLLLSVPIEYRSSPATRKTLRAISTHFLQCSSYSSSSASPMYRYLMSFHCRCKLY